jgi:hypothetical protein
MENGKSIENRTSSFLNQNRKNKILKNIFRQKKDNGWHFKNAC